MLKRMMARSLSCLNEQCRNRQSFTSVTPSEEIWNRASASAKHGELITLQIRSSALPFRSASLYKETNGEIRTEEARQDISQWKRSWTHYAFKRGPCCGSMRHDVPTNRFDLRPSKHCWAIHLSNNLVGDDYSNTKLHPAISFHENEFNRYKTKGCMSSITLFHLMKHY